MGAVELPLPPTPLPVTVSSVLPAIEPPASVAAIDIVPRTGRMDSLDRCLMVIVSMILTLLAGLMLVSLSKQWQKYDQAIDVALGSRAPSVLANAAVTGPDHAAALTYARALDEASIKMSALMLAFVLVFLGALYVLRTTTSAYHLGIQGQGTSGTLETSSPGLVMVTLGLVLVAIAVLHKTNIDYQGPTVTVPQTQDASQSAPAQPGLPLESNNGGAHK